jgi:hypothetical protein
LDSLTGRGDIPHFLKNSGLVSARLCPGLMSVQKSGTADQPGVRIYYFSKQIPRSFADPMFPYRAELSNRLKRELNTSNKITCASSGKNKRIELGEI